MKTHCTKRSFVLFILALALISTGCEKLRKKKELRIDLGTDFRHDFVKIKLDGDLVFSDSVNTLPQLGLAESIRLDYRIGKHEISVDVNGIEKTDEFRHKENRFIYIDFDRASSEINIEYPDEFYVYE